MCVAALGLPWDIDMKARKVHKATRWQRIILSKQVLSPTDRLQDNCSQLLDDQDGVII